MRWVMRVGAIASFWGVLVVPQFAWGEDAKQDCLDECRESVVECERILCGTGSPDIDSDCMKKCGEKYNECKKKCGT